SVEGWNSLSIHFFAAASSARTGVDPNAKSTAIAGTIFLSDIALTSLVACGLCAKPAGAHARPARPRPTPDPSVKRELDGEALEGHHEAPARWRLGRVPNQDSRAAAVAGAKWSPSLERRQRTSVAVIAHSWSMR